MTLKRLHGRPRRCVPESNDAVARRRRYQLAIVQGGHGLDVARVAVERLRGRPVVASQSLVVLSFDVDATSLPSGEKTTAITKSE